MSIIIRSQKVLNLSHAIRRKAQCRLELSTQRHCCAGFTVLLITDKGCFVGLVPVHFSVTKTSDAPYREVLPFGVSRLSIAGALWCLGCLCRLCSIRLAPCCVLLCCLGHPCGCSLSIRQLLQLCDLQSPDACKLTITLRRALLKRRHRWGP